MHFCGSVITHYDTFIPAVCKVEWTLRGETRENVSCGNRSYRGNGVGSVHGEKIAYGEKSAVRGVRCTQKGKHDDESKDCKTLPYSVQYVQTVRHYFAKKSLLCCRMDKSFDAHKSAHPAATGQIDIVGRFKVQLDSVLADL